MHPIIPLLRALSPRALAVAALALAAGAVPAAAQNAIVLDGQLDGLEIFQGDGAPLILRDGGRLALPSGSRGGRFESLIPLGPEFADGDTGYDPRADRRTGVPRAAGDSDGDAAGSGRAGDGDGRWDHLSAGEPTYENHLRGAR